MSRKSDSLVEISVVVIVISIMCLVAIYMVNRDIPIVYMSTASGKCISVSGGVCSDIDLTNDEYEKRWVQ